MNIQCRCSGRKFLSGIHLLSEVKKDVIRELGFGELLQLGCKEVNLDLCFWLIKNTNNAYSQLELFRGNKVSLTCYGVGMTMDIPHSGRKLIVEKGSVKASQMPSLQDIESMMVGIDDMEEFKRIFLIFACATLLAPTSRLEGSHSLWRKESVWIKGCLMFLQVTFSMYVELTIPHIAAWNDFLVKQRIKLELEMLGGFGKFELVSTSAEQDETEKNKAPAVDDPIDPNENEDFDVICAHMETTQRQSNCHEHVNESGAPFYTNNPQHSLVHSGGQRRSSEDDLGCTNEGESERPNVEEGVFFANEDPLHPGPHNMLVLVQSCMDNNADATSVQVTFVQLCVSKYKRLIEEETHVADYVFDSSKDLRLVPNHTFSKYLEESFIDIPVISMFCQYMNAKEENPSRRHFFNPYFGSTSKSTLKKRLGSYCVNLECCNQLLKNSFKRNDVNINNLHPQYADIVGDPKLCHTGMYAILYILEILKFATHMVLDSENEIGEMFTDKLIEEDEFDADQKDAFKAREARKKALQK
ncbi:hypothetical protein AAG906_014315 [Vitis piasezkii]